MNDAQALFALRSNAVRWSATFDLGVAGVSVYTLNAGTVPVIKFWYRQSPRHLKSTGFFGGTGRVSGNYPPANRSGMAEVVLDSAGHLYELTIVPPQVDEPIADPQEPDWSELFEHAGLDLSRFQRVDSTWTPPVWTDIRAA